MHHAPLLRQEPKQDVLRAELVGPPPPHDGGRHVQYLPGVLGESVQVHAGPPITRPLSATVVDSEADGDERREEQEKGQVPVQQPDRKSTRLNSSHANISYAVFCLKKKNN